MKTSETDNETAVLWQHQVIRLPNGLLGFLFYYYRTYKNPEKAKTFYRCGFTVCDKDFPNTIPSDNPAEIFRVSDLGIEDKTDWKLFYYKKYVLRVNMIRLMKKDFNDENIITLDEFLKKNKMKIEPFPEEYDGRHISDFGILDKGKWYLSDRKKKPRKSYGRVIH